MWKHALYYSWIQARYFAFQVILQQLSKYTEHVAALLVTTAGTPRCLIHEEEQSQHKANCLTLQRQIG